LTITLYDIFRTPLQVRIIEELLNRPNEYFTVSRMAKLLNASPSAVSSRVENLKKIGILKFISGSEKAKIFSLNKNHPVSRILADFYKKLLSINEH